MNHAISKLKKDKQQNTGLKTMKQIKRINNFLIARDSVINAPINSEIEMAMLWSEQIRASVSDASGMSRIDSVKSLVSSEQKGLLSAVAKREYVEKWGGIKKVNSLNINENDRSWIKTVMIIRNDMRNYFGLSFANKWGFFSDHHMSTLIHQFSHWLDYPKGHHSIAVDKQSQIYSAVNSSDGYYLYIGGEEYLSKWNLCNHVLVKSWKECETAIICLAYHKRGRLISADFQNTIRVRNAFKDDELIHTIQGHTNHVITVDVNLDGTLLLSGSIDQTMRLWSLESGECLRVFVDFTNFISCVHFMDDGRFMSADIDDSIRIWHPSIEKCQQMITDANLMAISQISINKDASILASAGSTGIYLFSLPEMEVKHVVNDGGRSCQFHPLNPNILAFHNQKKEQIMILDVSSGDMIDISEARIPRTQDLCFSPDGYRVLCVNMRCREIHILDISHLN